MWSMPRSVLRVVALIIFACAAGGFVMGLRGAPQRGQLPGEDPSGQVAAPIEAADFQPLDTDPAPPPKPEETAEAAEEKAAPAAATVPRLETPPPAPAAKAAPAPKAAPTQPAEDRVGDLIDGLTPPADTPPY